MADPVSVAVELCEQWNLATDPGSSSERFERFLAENRQHKLGRHSYSAEQFGLDPRELDERFSSYQLLEELLD